MKKAQARPALKHADSAAHGRLTNAKGVRGCWHGPMPRKRDKGLEPPGVKKIGRERAVRRRGGAGLVCRAPLPKFFKLGQDPLATLKYCTAGRCRQHTRRLAFKEGFTER